MPVPCGRCIACRLTYAADWSVRLMDEKRYHAESVFTTLTYDDDHVPEGGNLVKADAQKFVRSLRKITKKKIRYFIGGEYGSKGNRPHYHAILFGVSKSDGVSIDRAWRDERGNSKGFTFNGTVTFDSCNYVAKYIMKKLKGASAEQYELAGVTPEFCLMSRRPGLGERFVKQFGQEMVNRGFVLVKGSKVRIPRYYREKAFTTKAHLFVKESRRVRRELEEREKSLDKVAKMGYKALDGEIQASREGEDLMLKGKQNLRRRFL